MLRINDVKAVTPVTIAEAGIVEDAARVVDTSPPPAKDSPAEDGARGEKPQILEEALIEEVSIDGMCGVY
jgi:mycofactocin precursor